MADAPVVALARGRAFTFRYAETEELLAAAGCRVVGFDPLTDRCLPEGTRALYLGGGFPEVHLRELAANRPLLAQVADAVRAGLPTVAECAGLLYLLDELDGLPLAGVLAARAAMGPRLVLRYPRATAACDSLLSRAGEQVNGHEFHRTHLAVPIRGWAPAWEVDGELIGAASPTLHASYLHLHWAGAPMMAQRLAQAAANAATLSAAPLVVPAPVRGPERRDAVPQPEPDAEIAEPLTHHGDAEVGGGLLDLAVNVYPGPRPPWLEAALLEGVRAATSYPDAGRARAAIAELHGRRPEEVLVTAGAAEAFELIARVKNWTRPVVVHPQFTEPHAALLRAGHVVEVVACRAEEGFALGPGLVPEEADLVMLGNPTNPTGVLHPASAVERLRRPMRTVVVDEAFMDVVPGEAESMAGDRRGGVLVIRSLTKHWSMPGVRVGYVLGDATGIAALAALQVPWSVSTPALYAALACTGAEARRESARRAQTVTLWRRHLIEALTERGIAVQPSAASFVLARVPEFVRPVLRERGVAVRRADTFPGLGTDMVRIAVRPPETTARFLAALDAVLALADR